MARVVIPALAWLGPHETEDSLDTVLPRLAEEDLSELAAARAVMPRWRWSLRLKRDLAVASMTDPSPAWFLQPRVDAIDDYLVDGNVRISQQLTEHVRLTFTFDYFRDISNPPVAGGGASPCSE